jgi:hypothetical protein
MSRPQTRCTACLDHPCCMGVSHVQNSYCMHSAPAPIGRSARVGMRQQFRDRMIAPVQEVPMASPQDDRLHGHQLRVLATPLRSKTPRTDEPWCRAVARSAVQQTGQTSDPVDQAECVSVSVWLKTTWCPLLSQQRRCCGCRCTNDTDTPGHNRQGLKEYA